MRSTQRSAVATIVAFVAVGGTQATAGAADAYDRPGRNELVSVSSSGSQMTYPLVGSGRDTEFADVTPDGRFVAFSTSATGLAPGAGAGEITWGNRVYVRDRQRKRTVQASVAADGAQLLPPGSLSDALWQTVSANGRYVAFQSDAINLVPGDTNNAVDVFVKDLRTGGVKRASVSSTGSQAANGAIPSISANGRYVAFVSSATNLAPGDAKGGDNVYRHDLKTGKTVLVSANLRGKRGNANSRSPSISADGRYVAFSSEARDLVQNDTTGVECDCDAPNIFRRDVKAGKTVRVSVASDGSQASFAGLPSCSIGAPPLITLPPGGPVEQVGGFSINICASDVYWSRRAISADGRYVVFQSNASNLVPNDTAGQDVFVHDVKRGRTERISVDSHGQERDGIAYLGGVSAGGRYVHYTHHTARTELESSDPLGTVNDLLTGGTATARKWDTFVYDRVSGAMDQTSRTVSGRQPTSARCGPKEGIGGGPMSRAGGISADGRYAAMRSNVTNLVTKDTNDICDFFVRDRGAAVGVGGLGGVGSGTGPGGDDCVTGHICLPPVAQSSSNDPVGDVRDAAADLVGASAVYRPASRDLFVRLDVAGMPTVAGVPAGGPLYGLRFTVGGERYEVRVQRVPGVDFDPKGGASFGLFRQDAVTGLFTKVAALKGGYGTTGPSVVFAVPMKELGAGGPRLSDMRAFTGVGSYLAGVTKSLDTMRLSR